MLKQAIFVVLLSVCCASILDINRRELKFSPLKQIVRRFSIDHLEPIPDYVKGTESLKLQSYDIKNCSAADAEKASFVVRKLQITPDPVHFPGKITFSFDLNVLKDIDNLQVNITLKKKVQSLYVRIPCIGQYGSCTYDVCPLLSDVTVCPKELKDHNIDCKCPFKKNVYNVPEISADVQIPFLWGGDYLVEAAMTSGKDFVGCYIVHFNVS